MQNVLECNGKLYNVLEHALFTSARHACCKHRIEWMEFELSRCDQIDRDLSRFFYYWKFLSIYYII